MTNQNKKIQTITRLAILSAVATVLYQIEIPMFGHLKIDPSLIPSLVGGFIISPLGGVVVELIKNLIHLFRTSSAGLGELINFLVGSAVILPVCIVYHKNKTNKSFFIGSALSLLSILTVGAFLNYTLTAPYFAVLGLANPSQEVIMGYVISSLTLNTTKAVITLIPTYFLLPTLNKIK